MRKKRNAWEQQIVEFSKATANEACGVLAVQAGNQLEALELQNVHPQPEHCFLMEPRRYLELYRAGTVQAYWHSHPHGPAEFSEPDRVLSEETGLPCYLYAVEPDELVVYTPSGWAPPLEGRHFMPGVNDCFALVRDWHRQNTGLELELPQRTTEMLTSGIPDAQELLERNRLVRVVDGPRRGDLLVMHIRAAGSRPNHLGVFLGQGEFLHQLTAEPSQVAPWGGMWEHCCCMILRHQSLMTPARAHPAGTNLKDTMGTKLSPP